MAHYIFSAACIACGSCADHCPLGIISNAGSYYEIDASQCIDCGSCAAACPTDAIELE